MTAEARSRGLILGAAICVLTAVVFVSPFEESEFTGGRTTAIILRLYNMSVGLLVVATAVCLFRRVWIGAVAVLVAALLAVPLYTYVLLPGIFRSMVSGEYSVPLGPMAHWHAGAVSALVPLVATTSIALATLLRLRQLRNE